MLGSRGLGNPRSGEGDYRFLCTGDPEAFRALGTRFLQLPLGAVEHVDAADASGAMPPMRARALRRPRGRRAAPGRRSSPASCARATGSALISLRRDARDLHGVASRSPCRAGWPARAAAG